MFIEPALGNRTYRSYLSSLFYLSYVIIAMLYWP
jgi:hypothetical protein